MESLIGLLVLVVLGGWVCFQPAAQAEGVMAADR